VGAKASQPLRAGLHVRSRRVPRVFRDSGGPDLDENGSVAATHIFGTSWRAESPGHDHRLEAPAAQTFSDHEPVALLCDDGRYFL
jgi:hypothetical protein